MSRVLHHNCGKPKPIWNASKWLLQKIRAKVLMLGAAVTVICERVNLHCLVWEQFR